MWPARPLPSGGEETAGAAGQLPPLATHPPPPALPVAATTIAATAPPQQGGDGQRCGGGRGRRQSPRRRPPTPAATSRRPPPTPHDPWRGGRRQARRPAARNRARGEAGRRRLPRDARTAAVPRSPSLTGARRGAPPSGSWIGAAAAAAAAPLPAASCSGGAARQGRARATEWRQGGVGQRREEGRARLTVPLLGGSAEGEDVVEGEGARGSPPPPSRPLATCRGDSRHTPSLPPRACRGGGRVQRPAATPWSAVNRQTRLALRAGRRRAAGVSRGGNKAGLVANGSRVTRLTRDAWAAGTRIARARGGSYHRTDQEHNWETGSEPSIQPDKIY